MYPKVSVLKTASGDFMVWSGPDALGKMLLSEGIHEASIINVSKYILSSIKDRVPHVLDIGANIGSYAIPVARELGEKVAISCFEVQKPVFYQLCGNIFLNSLSNVTAYNYAVGERTQKVDIPSVNYETCFNVGGYSIDPTAQSVNRLDFPNSTLQGNVQVQMYALDDFEELAPTDLIKLDIECYELEAIRGMRSYLERSGFPPLIIELFPTPPHDWFIPKKNQLLEMLKNIGYADNILDVGYNNFLFQNINSSHNRFGST